MQLEVEEDQLNAIAPSIETKHTPLGNRFYPGEFIHLQFDGGSTQGEGTGGFVLVTSEGQELVRAGMYYGQGFTNNEAEAYALKDALECLEYLKGRNPDLNLPIRIWGDS